jgi:hypothetical protein
MLFFFYLYLLHEVPIFTSPQYVVVLQIKHLLYIEGFFELSVCDCMWMVLHAHSAWNCLPSSLCTNFRDKLLRGQPPSNFYVWFYWELLHVLKRKMQRLRKKLSIANKIMRFWVLVLRNPYCPMQSQKMLLVEASTNFSLAIVAFG